MARQRDVLTTGEVARVCNVAPRTVSKWFDSGKLQGYRIPGSKDRRIPLQQLVRFMKTHGIPLNGLESGNTRVLVAENDSTHAETLSRALTGHAQYDVQVARSALEAGILAESFKPHVMLLDIRLLGLEGRESVRIIRSFPDLQSAKLVAVSDSTRDGESETLRQQGFDAALIKPFEVSQAVRVIEETLTPTG